MNTLDIIVLAVLLISAAFAYMRGFVREVLAIIAWIGAAIVTYYAYPFAVPFAERFLPKGPIANIAAGAVVFIVALIILSIITATVARRVHHGGVSSFDRLFGLLFGLVRGAVLVALGYIALTWYVGDRAKPQWEAQARSLPLLQAGGNAIRSLLPSDWDRQVKNTAARAGMPMDQGNEADHAVRALAAPKAPAKPASPAPVYKPNDRAEMNRLFDQQQGQDKE